MYKRMTLERHGPRCLQVRITARLMRKHQFLRPRPLGQAAAPLRAGSLTAEETVRSLAHSPPSHSTPPRPTPPRPISSPVRRRRPRVECYRRPRRACALEHTGCIPPSFYACVADCEWCDAIPPTSAPGLRSIRTAAPLSSSWTSTSRRRCGSGTRSSACESGRRPRARARRRRAVCRRASSSRSVPHHLGSTARSHAIACHGMGWHHTTTNGRIQTAALAFRRVATTCEHRSYRS
jgi:hypothetical protein